MKTDTWNPNSLTLLKWFGKQATFKKNIIALLNRWVFAWDKQKVIILPYAIACIFNKAADWLTNQQYKCCESLSSFDFPAWHH